jgi:hypothetical protein
VLAFVYGNTSVIHGLIREQHGLWELSYDAARVCQDRRRIKISLAGLQTSLIFGGELEIITRGWTP